MDWHEHQSLLKVHFPVNVHTDEATFEIQYGNLTRKTHANTSWDRARFESCGQKWMDLSEGHYGVSMLNDCKYGHSVKDSVIGLTLIKSGIEPNPTTDQEVHHFTYAIYPHAEKWQAAGTVPQAFFLNQPALAVQGGKPGFQPARLHIAPPETRQLIRAPQSHAGKYRHRSLSRRHTESTLLSAPADGKSAKLFFPLRLLFPFSPVSPPSGAR